MKATIAHPLRLAFALLALIFVASSSLAANSEKVVLPPGYQFANVPHSIFREYQGTMLALGGLLTAQFLTIAALLLQSRRRRLAEAEAMARGTELARAARIATVGELSASIAHEIGQPLGAILSNAAAADLLVKSAIVDVDELQEILADVRRDALRAHDVVKRLRALLQKQSVSFRPLALDEVVESALVLLRPEARRRRVRIEASLDIDGGGVLGDEVQLQQVVLNLVLNAMDAMADTAPDQRALSIATYQSAGSAMLVVTDRGTGFGPNTSRRLFEPFYTSKPNGMGLGLSIARSIVSAHGGDIKAESRHGGGAVFTVSLRAISASRSGSQAQTRFADLHVATGDADLKIPQPLSRRAGQSGSAC